VLYDEQSEGSGRDPYRVSFKDDSTFTKIRNHVSGELEDVVTLKHQP